MNTDDEKISSLYHEADSPAPSKRLDDTILAASREAVGTPAATRGPFSGNWPAAVSIAAVIVITIILVPVLQQQEPQPALTQATSETGRSLDAPDETELNAYRPTEVKKKSADAPSPASAPVMLLEESDFSGSRAMPARNSAGSSAATSPAADAASPSVKEEVHVESDSFDPGRSRMQAADSAPFAILTPEMWQVKISRLITEGKIDEARAEIEKLEKHYPEHIIDPNLLEKLE
jgi:hypothetical protein